MVTRVAWIRGNGVHSREIMAAVFGAMMLCVFLLPVSAEVFGNREYPGLWHGLIPQTMLPLVEAGISSHSIRTVFPGIIDTRSSDELAIAATKLTFDGLSLAGRFSNDQISFGGKVLDISFADTSRNYAYPERDGTRSHESHSRESSGGIRGWFGLRRTRLRGGMFSVSYYKANSEEKDTLDYLKSSEPSIGISHRDTNAVDVRLAVSYRLSRQGYLLMEGHRIQAWDDEFRERIVQSEMQRKDSSIVTSQRGLSLAFLRLHDRHSFLGIRAGIGNARGEMETTYYNTPEPEYRFPPEPFPETSQAFLESFGAVRRRAGALAVTVGARLSGLREKYDNLNNQTVHSAKGEVSFVVEAFIGNVVTVLGGATIMADRKRTFLPADSFADPTYSHNGTDFEGTPFAFCLNFDKISFSIVPVFDLNGIRSSKAEFRVRL